MKIQDRIKGVEGVTDAHWDSQYNRLVVYYSDIVSLDTMKVRVAGAIGDANLQEAVEKITLISEHLTNAEILATADPSFMFDKRLQLAHDRMLLCPTGPETEEYGVRWAEYLAAGGDRTMRDKGIDLENWRQYRKA